jgi:hypothetical protein
MMQAEALSRLLARPRPKLPKYRGRLPPDTLSTVNISFNAIHPSTNTLCDAQRLYTVLVHRPRPDRFTEIS